MANIKIIEKKTEKVNEIASKVKEATSVIFFDYQGLEVCDITELRKSLKAVDAELKVYKNSLTKRAMDELEFDLGDNLTGPNAITFSTNLVEPIKVLTEFAKKNTALEVKVGIIEGEVKGIEVLNELATIPSREGLLTMLAGGMLATVKDLSISLHMLGEKLEDGTEKVTEDVRVETTEEVAVEETVEEKAEKTAE